MWRTRPRFVETVTLTLLLLLFHVDQGHLHPHNEDNNESDNNVVGRRGGSNSNDNENQLVRRERGHSDVSLSTSQLVTNVTALVGTIDRGCATYCGDQVQYNGICVSKGCGEWKAALRDGCFTTCTGVINSYRENYACQLGCSRAVEDYNLRLSRLLTPLVEPPALLSSSLTSTSLRLRWDGAPLLPPLPPTTYSLQRRENGGLWETLNASPTNATNFSVINLRPYSVYQFRVGWILASDHAPLYSRESNAMQTLADGLPSAPTVTSIQPISNTSVAITWSPPSAPNGQLVAYRLRLRPHGGLAVIKELPASQKPRGYTFSGLLPTTNYSLALFAVNLEGEGEASQVTFVTPQSVGPLSNEISKSPEARLIIQGAKDVYIQPLDLLMEPSSPFFTSPQNVTGIDVHVKRGWVFVATSEGEIRRISLHRTGNESAVTVIMTKELLDLGVAHLSVDWLHDKLYIVGKKKRGISAGWVIKRCDLQGRALTTIYSKMPTRPLHFAADPFTGYLYWVSPSSPHSAGGLYKLDLISDRFPGVYPTPPLLAQAVMEESDLGPFALDVANYRILIIHKGRNKVLSVSLDGDISNIRENTQSPQWSDAVSLSLYNGVLFWTTTTSVVTEEFNTVANIYYQNSYDVPKSLQPLGSLLVLHPSAQPTPIPMAAPQQLQVLYGQTRARITWRPPPPISALGVGAWAEWVYTLRLSDNRSFTNITTTDFTVDTLRPSTFYSVQVAAYSPTGRGPMSQPNRGKTLSRTAYNISLIWGSGEGLYSTDTLGEDVTLLTSTGVTWSSQQATKLPRVSVTTANAMSSLTWFEGTVFYALSNGSVFIYVGRDESSSSSSSKVSLVKDVDTVGGTIGGTGVSLISGISFAQSIAFDYIGQRLYWSNPKVQTIYRCALTTATTTNTTSCVTREPLQVVTMAREIAVDSYKGLLLWSTGHSIEMSRMNGYAHGTLVQNGLFSGKQIMGMTLDTEQSRIYWITRSASGSSLQRLQYNIRGAQMPMVIANFEDTSITGPIRYFNDRLLWLQGSSEAVITDLYGQGKSSLRLATIPNITNVHVKDQGSLKYPGGLAKSRVNVNPDPVSKWSIDISGQWNNFTLSWLPVNNTNYGKVLYEVIVEGVISRITEHPNITIDNTSPLFTPYSELSISITALTYWSSAKATLAKKRVPPAKPSAPRHPRVYSSPSSRFPYVSTLRSNLTPSVELRWDAPTSPNGVILGYIVSCWNKKAASNKGTDSSSNGGCICDVDLDSLSCRLRPSSSSSLQQLDQFQFSVQAYNSAGAGPGSSRVGVLSSSGHQVASRLLLTCPDKLELLDVDRNAKTGISLGYVAPISAGFLGVDNAIYWFNEGQDLMVAKMDGSPGYNKSRLLSLSGGWETSHLTMDWIGRRLYWAVESVGGSAGVKASSQHELKYGIMSFDLAEMEGHRGGSKISRQQPHYAPSIVIHSKTSIRSVAFNPFRNALYWTTSKRFGATTLYTAEGRDNFTVRPFLSRSLPEDSTTTNTLCNCSHVVISGDPVAFDPSRYAASIPRAVLFLGQDGVIWAADETGCTCLKIANSTQGSLRSSTTSPTTDTTIVALAGDASHIYWSGGRGYVTAQQKHGANETVMTTLVHSGVREVRPFGPTAQPFPPQECLIPRRMVPEEPLLFNHSSHSLHLDLPLGISVNCSMEDLSLPTPQYAVYYGTVDETLISKCTPTSSSHCKVVHTREKSLHITDLHPYTTYTVFVTLTNAYSTRAGLPPLLCTPIMLRTAPGAPMPPDVPSLQALTPTSVRVEWTKPLKLNGEKVWYEVHWATGDSSSSAKWAETESTRLATMTTDLHDLAPSTNYTIWVRAFSEKGDAFSDSPKKSVATFPLPGNLSLVRATPHELQLRWVPPGDNTIIMHQLLHREASSLLWTETRMENFTIPGRAYNWTLSRLKPKSLYLVRLRAWFSGDPSAPFIHPAKAPFHFETKADKPSPPPGAPIARGIGKALYEVEWKAADENGAVIEAYSLEARLVYSHATTDRGDQSANGTTTTMAMVILTSTPAPSLSPATISTTGRRRVKKRDVGGAAEKRVASSHLFAGGYDWNQVYSGKETRWVVEGLDLKSYYNFRVRAKNSYGWGSYSNESEVVSLAELTLVAEPQGVGVIIGIIFLSSFVLGLFALLFILVYRRRLSEKPSLHGSHHASERREVELATLRELPGGSSFIHQNNLLYSTGHHHQTAAADLLLDLDLAGIPKVNWHQIIVTKFLGSGAFGEVYEGIAANLGGHGDPEIRVAIKTLRKGANSLEKQEFIQEAKLMAQFRHPHIIQLMGLCIDTDPCYLLLELMGEGDLLSYLRSNRPSHGGHQTTTPITHDDLTSAPAPLNLADLLRMCVDVAKGCVYLEDLHFVHRDIAARNCLVSFVSDGTSSSSGGGEERKMRVVKIGDFGLARDIYRNDYYRKDGEGLLPVRWMAPESLVDGIFTTQTDVWAFGVLLWEIMTLGQQPYPARSNVDVLNYVRGGGRLQRPPHCPHILGNLMLQCWEYAPENRPSFKDCLSQLELILGDFHLESGRVSFPPLHDIHFDPYSYSEGGAGGGGHYASPQHHLRSEDNGPDSVFPEDDGGDDVHRHHHNYHHHQRRIPNYLEVLSEEELSSQRGSISLTDQGYEIPLPKRPPRSSSSHPSTASFGLPSPPPSYWNAETLPLRQQQQQLPRPQYRNLLASSTSEDADVEEDVDDHQPTCSIPHHYFSNNMMGRPTHLRGLPCQYVDERRTADNPTTTTTTLFNNHTYAAQHLNGGGGMMMNGGGGSSSGSDGTLLHYSHTNNNNHHNQPPKKSKAHSAA